MLGDRPIVFRVICPEWANVALWAAQAEAIFIPLRWQREDPTDMV